jgi:hypothetical protein
VILGSSRRSSTAPVQLDELREIHLRSEHVLDVAVVEVECVRGSLNPGRDAHRQFVDEVPGRSLSTLFILSNVRNGNPIPSTSARRM